MILSLLYCTYVCIENFILLVKPNYIIITVKMCDLLTDCGECAVSEIEINIFHRHTIFRAH